MPLRGRDLVDDGPYRDDPEDGSPEALSQQDTVGDDALSFLGIDHTGMADEEASGEDLSAYQQKHSFIRFVPPRLRKAWKATVQWSQGPQPPRPWKITPILEEYQTAHLRLLDKLMPAKSQKIWLLLAFYFLWLLVFSLVLWKSAFSSEIKGYGKPQNIGCQARFWYVTRK
jgi:hypothetical protein